MRRSKYGAIRTTIDNITFASKAESARYVELKLEAKHHLIDHLELQPKFPLVVNGVKIGTYIADFRYLDCETGQSVTEDVKGVRTPVFNLKAKLVRALYGLEIKVVKS